MPLPSLIPWDSPSPRSLLRLRRAKSMTLAITGAISTTSRSKRARMTSGGGRPPPRRSILKLTKRAMVCHLSILLILTNLGGVSMPRSNRRPKSWTSNCFKSLMIPLAWANRSRCSGSNMPTRTLSNTFRELEALKSKQ